MPSSPYPPQRRTSSSGGPPSGGLYSAAPRDSTSTVDLSFPRRSSGSISGSSGMGSTLQLEVVASHGAAAGGKEQQGGGAETEVIPVHRPRREDVAPPELSVDLRGRKRWIAGYLAFLVFCNTAIPCILFYVLKDQTSMNLQTLIGISSGSLGISSCFDNPYRMWKLWKRWDELGPVGDTVWWHMDCTMHVYSFALLVFAIPLSIASIPNPPFVRFFLMSTSFFVGAVGVAMAFSLLGLRLPVWCSSDPPASSGKWTVERGGSRGGGMRPMCYYFFEDICAVEFDGGRAFREAAMRRYDASPPFRAMMWWLTAFWAVGCFLYVVANAAVAIAETPRGHQDADDLDFAFGWVLGQLFVFATLWAGASVLLVKWGQSRERGWWRRKFGGRKGEGAA